MKASCNKIGGFWRRFRDFVSNLRHPREKIRRPRFESSSPSGWIRVVSTHRSTQFQRSTYFAGASFFTVLTLPVSLLFKNPQETRSQLFKLWVSRRCWTSLQHLALMGSKDFWRFLGLFGMNSWKLTRKVDRTDTLKFPKAIFSACKLSVDWRTRCVFTFLDFVSGPAIGGEDVHFRTLPDSYPWSGIAKLGARMWLVLSSKVGQEWAFCSFLSGLFWL